MKYIQLSKGFVASVDDEDYEELSKYQWYFFRNKNKIYVERKIFQNGVRKRLMMHRQILGIVGQRSICDHIDGNGLNNVRSNLRICSNSENCRNRGKNSNNTSGFKGVYFRKDNGKWMSKIGVDGRIVYLGNFGSPELAHEAYKAASEKLHKEFGRSE